MAHWCWLDMKWCGSLSGLTVFVSCHFVSWCLPFSLVFSRLCCQLCCQHFSLVCSIVACFGLQMACHSKICPVYFTSIKYRKQIASCLGELASHAVSCPVQGMKSKK